MATAVQAMTADELSMIPRSGHRYELVAGELRIAEPAGFEHGKIAMRISWPLGQYVSEQDLGIVCAAETGFRIATDPDTVRAPDIAFVSNEQIQRIGETTGYWPGAPDLVVEVVSPNDSYNAVDEKVLDWLAAGCRMVIIVNPRRRTVTVFHSLNRIEILTEEDMLRGEDVLPGWSLPVRAIFN